MCITWHKTKGCDKFSVGLQFSSHKTNQRDSNSVQRCVCTCGGWSVCWLINSNQIRLLEQKGLLYGMVTVTYDRENFRLNLNMTEERREEGRRGEDMWGDDLIIILNATQDKLKSIFPNSKITLLQLLGICLEMCADVNRCIFNLLQQQCHGTYASTLCPCSHFIHSFFFFLHLTLSRLMGRRWDQSQVTSSYSTDSHQFTKGIKTAICQRWDVNLWPTNKPPRASDSSTPWVLAEWIRLELTIM